ncbi:CotO family spore coat protein [Alkalibacillus aidingensis]|uniref:CotO family spore coat protein n=1 Tax=Alkalibacillus aidingensis TaxID=2747607 RepID=UPI001660C911|nr:CotO family spore coat protein [Alkalibacillus aidingensis]
MPDNQVKPPLLFIAQRSEKGPTVEAQPFFYSNQEVFKQIEEETDIESKNNESKGPTKRRKFQDMTVEEKLNYMNDMPSIMPKMKCEVVTDRQTYLGTVERCDDELLLLKSVKNGYRVKIKRSDIQDVRLMGF